MTNPLAVHNKLTDEHIYVTDTGKMRNHLATDVMNEEMLNLMQVCGFDLSQFPVNIIVYYCATSDG